MTNLEPLSCNLTEISLDERSLFIAYLSSLDKLLIGLVQALLISESLFSTVAKNVTSAISLLIGARLLLLILKVPNSS